MADSRHFNGYKKEKHMNRKQILAVGGVVAFATTAFADARSLVVGPTVRATLRSRLAALVR